MSAVLFANGFTGLLGTAVLVVGGASLVRPELGQRWHSKWSSLMVNIGRLSASLVLFSCAWVLASPVVLAAACFVATMAALLGIFSVWPSAHRMVQDRVMAGTPNTMRVYVALTMLPLGAALIGRLVVMGLVAGD